MIRRVPAVVAGAAGLVVLAGTIGGGLVFAAGNDTPPTPQAHNGAPVAPGDRGQRLDDYLQKLAANLHVSVDQLKGALKQTATDEIDQALNDGKLTSDQAQKLKDAINNGTNVPLGPGGFGMKIPNGQPDPNGKGKPGVPGPMGGLDMLPGGINDLAGFLGITPQQLKQEMGSGKSLADVASAHGKSPGDLKNFLTDEANKQFDAMVAAGKMTADQATKLKTAFLGNLDAVINGQMPQGRPFAGPHGAGPNGQAMPKMSPGSMGSGAGTRGAN